MKKCSICQQTYADDDLNFCLNDGGSLNKISDDAPPTVFMNQARATSPANWSNAEPPAHRQNPQMSAMNQSFINPAVMTIQNQTLPTVSLILGIFGTVLSLCCYAGIPLGLAGLITGYIGFSNANKDARRCGGRNLAIGGMITGGIGLTISLLTLLILLIKM